MPPRRCPIQEAMEDDRIFRLQQVIENLADSVAALQIQMQQQQQQQAQQQQQQARQQQQQRPDPCFMEDEEIFPEKIIENNDILDTLEGGSDDWDSPPIFDVDDVCMGDCLFTPTIIPDPVVDWSTSPVFDEESPIFGEESCFDEEQTFVEETIKEGCHKFFNPVDSIVTEQGVDMHPEYFDCFHGHYHFEEPFYFAGMAGVEFDQPLGNFLDEQADEEAVGEEHVTGDDGPLLVVRRACLTPRDTSGDGWLRNNIFQSRCTVGGKVCKFVIDSGSCENVISEEAVRKLELATEKHPNPYKLTWLQEGKEVTVSNRCLVSLSIGSTYKDRIWCDVVEMDACHILLGRPWQFDRAVQHDGRKNTYSFVINKVKVLLYPGKAGKPKQAAKGHPTLLTMQPLRRVLALLQQEGFVAATAKRYSKLAARKIGPWEVVDKVNPNAYRLNLPSHVNTSDVFNVKHLLPCRGNSSGEEEEGLNSRSNSFQPGENDAERRAKELLDIRRCRRRGIVAGSSLDVAGKDRESAEIWD